MNKENFIRFFPDALEKVQVSKAAQFDNDGIPLPEKILQFGSGNLFKELSDFRIDKTIKEEIFNGRVVLIKSSSNSLSERVITKNSVVSRVLYAKEQWPEVLTCAVNPELAIIISDKKIARKDLLKDNIKSVPPFSFPGKLLALLFERFKYFNGNPSKGLIIISVAQPENKTDFLESILLELAHLNNLEPAFLDWIENANQFFNRW